MRLLCCNCSRPVVALFVESLQRTNSEAIGGTADMPRTRRARRSDAFDPSATLAVRCGNGFGARFELYQSTRLSRYQCWPLGLGADMRRREFTRSESEAFSTRSIRAYSICAPEALMMGAHFASSALMNSAVLAGVMPGVGSIPASCRRWRTAGSASALVMAALSASIIG